MDPIPPSDGVAPVEVRAAPSTPKFLVDMARDQPELVARVAKDLPEWAVALDKFAGHPNFAATVLQTMEYIGREETRAFVDGVVTEVREKLEASPDKKIYFGQTGESSRSGKYFFNRIVAGLPEDQRSRVELKSHSAIANSRESVVDQDIYFVDDSANSGQQLQHFLTVFHRRSDGPTRLHVRLMRASEFALSKVEHSQKMFTRAGNQVTVDIQTQPVASIRGVMQQLDLHTGDIPTALMYPHHRIGEGILTIFRHRMQDNLASFLTQGVMTAGYAANGVKPLFRQHDEIVAYED